MTQQIFDQYAPLAKVSANETIPVVAAIAQTRDGKDELLHGTVPFVPAGGLYVPVSAANRLPVEATLSGRIKELEYDSSTASSILIEDVEQYNSLTLIVKGARPTLYLEGRSSEWGSGDWQLIPAIGRSGEEVPWPTTEGVWTWDIRGVDFLRLIRYSSESDFEAYGALSTDLAPPPTGGIFYGSKRFVRIEPEDGRLSGRFYAIKALTDITLHSDIRFLPSFFGDSDRDAGLSDEDELLRGDILYGPFDRVRISSGVALVYNL